jgi:hypothetical protein
MMVSNDAGHTILPVSSIPAVYLSTNGLGGSGVFLAFSNGVPVLTNAASSGGTGSSNMVDSGTSVLFKGSVQLTNTVPLSQLVVGATTGSGQTNHFEVVNVSGNKVFQVGTNGVVYGINSTNIAGQSAVLAPTSNQTNYTIPLLTGAGNDALAC